MSSSVVTQLGAILGIWAHPDDETFLVGGLLHEAAKAGQKVSCITATKGEAGVQDETRWPVASLGDTRTQELATALEILGASQPHWLQYRDGECAQANDQEATDQIRALIEEYQPDTVITFAPDGLTGHDDHKAVSRWTTAAVQQLTNAPALYYAVHTHEQYEAVFRELDEKLNIYFNTTEPQLVPTSECSLQLNLSLDTLATKIQALKAMPSQFDSFFAQCTDSQAALAFGTEALVFAK